MSLVINHNLMAANVARNLNTHYGNLSKSTQRLSTGLRVNSAADDAAGLAIRELQRADIAALQQGARNANDAISLIQTADGALGIIDEKLIRMKELAEQAATGTYDSTQRLMIESEYQAMASEITRIANATDFNGIHLLNGNLSSGLHDGSGLTSTGKLKVHFGSGNDSSEDYYYITIGDCTAQAFSLGSAATWHDAYSRINNSLYSNFLQAITEQYNSGNITKKDYESALSDIDGITSEFITSLNIASLDYWDFTPFYWMRDKWLNNGFDSSVTDIGYSLPDNFASINSQEELNALDQRDKEKLHYAFGRAALYNFAHKTDPNYDLIPGTNINVDHYFISADNPTNVRNIFRNVLRQTSESALDKYNYSGMSIATQEDAQLALEAINDAIVEKDNIRAHLGATQNRLENTITNLNTQAENLQAAESRISDVDVATEMTEFVRQQILAQSAVAMLSQANSMPQMAMQLIGG